MSIDFETAEGRKAYLSDKLNDLLNGISETYGSKLLDELISRLETTVKDFNDEMMSLCDELHKKEKERQQIVELMKSDVAKNTNLSTQPINTNINQQTSNLPQKEINQEINSDLIQSADPDLGLNNEIEELTEWEKKLEQLKK